jgi:hypothetical protein
MGGRQNTVCVHVCVCVYTFVCMIVVFVCVRVRVYEIILTVLMII